MVRVGHSLIIPINYVSEPAARVEWFYNDQPLSEATPGVSIDGAETFSTLTVKKMATNNSGQYTVKLTNKAGSVSAKFDISVTGMCVSSHVIVVNIFLFTKNTSSSTGILIYKI